MEPRIKHGASLSPAPNKTSQESIKLLERLGAIIESRAASGEGDDEVTRRGVARKGHEGLTILELVLQLEGDIRRRLEPIHVTPLQAGVLFFCIVTRRPESRTPPRRSA